MPKAIPVEVKVRTRRNRSTKRIVVKPCVCDRCGQESNAQPDTAHAVCKGFRLLAGKSLPALFENLRPKHPGIWRIKSVQEAPLAETG
jgi:hypothetical protein